MEFNSGFKGLKLVFTR